MTTQQAEAVRVEALSWMGTRFRHEAQVKGVGVDCVHLAIAVYESAGLLRRGFTAAHYSPDWMLHTGAERLIAGVMAHCDPAGPPWEVGDLLLYRYGRAVSHCGIYVGDGRLVHAVSRQSVRCDQVDMPALTSRFAGGYRIRTV